MNYREISFVTFCQFNCFYGVDGTSKRCMKKQCFVNDLCGCGGKRELLFSVTFYCASKEKHVRSFSRIQEGDKTTDSNRTGNESKQHHLCVISSVLMVKLICWWGRSVIVFHWSNFSISFIVPKTHGHKNKPYQCYLHCTSKLFWHIK